MQCCYNKPSFISSTGFKTETEKINCLWISQGFDMFSRLELASISKSNMKPTILQQ